MLCNYDQEYITALSYVKRAKNRKLVIKIIARDMKMPSDIANITNLRINQISATLTELKTNNIVVCINEDEKKGRFYRLTELGLRIYEFLDENELE